MYYPKSQVKTGLYTNGSEYVVSTTQQDYIGYYFEVSNGKKYTGTNPNNSAIELTPFNSSFGITGPITQTSTLQTNPIIPETIVAPVTITTPTVSPEDVIRYSNGNNTSTYSTTFNAKPRAIPQFGLTYPTDQEKQKGIFTRYFCKKNNELRYMEITKSTHDRLVNKNDNIAWDLYTSVSIPWRISGDISQAYSSNQASVFQVEGQNSFIAFSQYFKGKFSQYYVE
jgi:hypothetical protein